MRVDDVIIPLEEYKRLITANNELQRLLDLGVDKWVGYQEEVKVKVKAVPLTYEELDLLPKGTELFSTGGKRDLRYFLIKVSNRMVVMDCRDRSLHIRYCFDNWFLSAEERNTHE